MTDTDTLRIVQVNTLRIATDCIDAWMDTPADRLRRVRLAAGFTSAAKAAERFGWGESTYRSHENGTRAFDADTARRYARAFRTKAGYLLGFEAANDGSRALRHDAISIEGVVAAGLWQEPDELAQLEDREIVVGPNPFPGARRFALEVEGFSMDREYPPGTLLDCVSIFDIGIEPAPGDDVIVERIRGDGRRELTVKRFQADDTGRRWLVPESTQPEFQQPILFDCGTPQNEEIAIQVIAFVIGAYRPRSRRLLDRM